MTEVSGVQDSLVRSGESGERRAPVRLLVGDAQPLVRRGLRAVFQAESGFELIAEIDNGAELPSLAWRLGLEVAVLDIDLPGADVISLANSLTSGEEPRCDVVLLADRLDADVVLGALQAGARGLLYKDDQPEDLVRAIKAVAAGQAMLSPRVAGQVLEALRGDPPLPLQRDVRTSQPPSGEAAAIGSLSPRELQIFRMIAEGYSNQQIAESLLVSEATVKSHFNRIGKKLGLRGRVQAVIMAYRNGLVRGSS
ncbi:response regulator transcription factor [Saccharopolyspora shandongensis]|uniref:response regulator transcription factor n=1 Tax=Saccharopolyspora shandongensis TaxID=418495 RepID=UPI0033FB962B